MNEVNGCDKKYQLEARVGTCDVPHDPSAVPML